MGWYAHVANKKVPVRLVGQYSSSNAQVSDSVANAFRVVKCVKQTSTLPLSYAAAVAGIVRQDGVRGLMLRGLGTKLLSNAFQSIVFSVFWRLLQDAWRQSGGLGLLPPAAQAAARGGGQVGALRSGEGEAAQIRSPVGVAALPGGRDGEGLPRIGFGTAGLGERTAEAVGLALAAGYRLLDSAQAREWYREDLVAAALQASSVPREQVSPPQPKKRREEGRGMRFPCDFPCAHESMLIPLLIAPIPSQVWITSKLHPKHLGYQKTLAAFPATLAAFNTTYVDLFILHYPSCWDGLPGCPQTGGGSSTAADEPADWRASWRALETLWMRGQARHIGVSNFDAAQLRELLAITGQTDGAEGGRGAKAGGRAPVAVVQARSDPLAQQRELQAVCASAGVVFQAYSSLGTQWGGGGNPVLTAPPVVAAAAAHGVSAAAVVLRWALAHGQAVIPRSSSREHIEGNLRVGDLELSADELQAIDALDGGRP